MSVLINGATLTVTRFAQGSEVKGNWVLGAPSTFTITGTVQPVPGSILQTLPEGKRSRDMKFLSTDAKLQMTDPLTQVDGDIVTIEGQDWIVESVQPWQNGIIPHYEYIMIRSKEGA